MPHEHASSRSLLVYANTAMLSYHISITTNILRDLQGLTVKAVGLLASRWLDQEKRIDAYRNYKVTEMRSPDLIIRALDPRAVTVTPIPAILHEYREPRHSGVQRPHSSLSEN